MPNYENIVVAIDGSKEAEYAFNKAIRIAKLNTHSKLYLVYIFDTRVYSANDLQDASTASKTREFIEKLFDDYVKQAKEAGISNIDTIIENGLPKSDISKKVAKRVEADLIICGATGHTKLERLLVGSVSESIVKTASCDVLVVRIP